MAENASPRMFYYAEFRHSMSKGVGINTRETQKLWSTEAPLPWDGCVANPGKQVSALAVCVNKR